MSHILLIHGSWHGAWCWRKVAPLLEREGNRVSVIDLPGRGRNPARPISVGLRGLEKAALKMLPAGEQTTVVAHSRYGILASRLAERAPERIARTIYLASFMLPPGAVAASYARRDKGSDILNHVQIGRIGLWDRLAPDCYQEILYHDCGEEDLALARLMLTREPLRPALARLKLTEGRYGSVPRAYIRLTEDRAVSPYLQDLLIEQVKADRVESLKSSHSAYFSQPDALARTILRLGGA